MENITIKCINILRTSLVTFRVWVNPYPNERHTQTWKWQYHSKLQHQKTLAYTQDLSSLVLLLTSCLVSNLIKAEALWHTVCVVLCARTGFNRKYSVDTSDWIAAAAFPRVCHSLLAIQQLSLNVLWIQLLNPTSKYNHNDILQKVNKKLLPFLSRTKKELVCPYYAFFPNNSTAQLGAHERHFPLAVSVHFYLFCPCLPTQPHSVSPPVSHSCPASLKAEWVVRLNTCYIMMLTIPCPCR